MAKVKLALEETKDLFLYSTEIENLFINEFLPGAPGDYVKVYLFGLMCARHNQDIDKDKLAMILRLSEEDVEEAWIYWESKGLVRRTGSGEDAGLVFISQIEALYGKSAAVPEMPPEEDDDADEEDVPIYLSIDDMDYDEVVNRKLVDRKLRDLYQKYQNVTGRTVSRQETSKIEDAVRVYGIEPEIFDFAIDYCADLEKYSVDYIFKVALRWNEEGCRTVEDARKLLDRHSRRNSWYRQVFSALGFNRLPAPSDREIMDRWFDEMKFSIGEVLEACGAAAGLRDPNLRYVNKVLENRVLEKGGVKVKAAADAGAAPPESGRTVSRKVLADYYEYIRTEDEKAREARTEEVIAKVPEMKKFFEEEARVNRKLLSTEPGNLDERQRLRAERIAIEESKKQLLAANGWPADHLSRKFRCEKCRDTGFTDEGMVCSCCRERAAEAYEWHTNIEKA